MIDKRELARIVGAGLCIAAVMFFGMLYIQDVPASALSLVVFGAIGLGLAMVFAAGKLYDRKFNSKINKALPAFLGVIGTASVLGQVGLADQAVGPIIVLLLAIGVGELALGRLAGGIN